MRGALDVRARSRTVLTFVWTAGAFTLGTGCLLTTSLDGLEGPPIVVDAGSADAILDAAGGDAGDVEESGADVDDRADGARTDTENDRTADSEVDSTVDSENDGSSDARNDGIADGSDAPDQTDAGAGPIAVAPTGDVVRGLAAHGAEIYWVQGDPNGGVIRAPKAGGGSPTFVQTTPDAFDVDVDDTYVYWSTGQRNEVLRKAIGSTSAAQILYSGAGETRYLAIGTVGRVYVTGASAIVVGPIADASTSWVHYASQTGASGIGSNGAELFWSSDFGIARGDENGQAPRPVLAAAPREILGVASDGEDVFWIAEDGTLRAAAVASPVPAPPRDVCKANIGAPSTSAARDVAVDDAWVYFAEPPLRRISKCPKR